MAVTPLRLRFTVPQFRAYVKTLPKPTWGVRCISLHHTYIPDEHTWHGQRSVDGIVAYWRTLGWSRWVHLFVALEAGVGYVYVCNPLTLRGTGVRGRNADSIHIEHPWNGDVTPFDSRLVAASNEVQAAVGDWAGIPVQRIDPNPSVPDRGLFYHRWRRDAYKTCPGSRVRDADLIGRPQPTQEDDMNAEQDQRLKAVEQAITNLQADVDRSQRASSYRESITVAIANGDREEAARLNAEALAWNKANPGKPPIVTGYRPRP